MTRDLTEIYLDIRTRIMETPCPDLKLQEFKLHFRNDMDSERRYDRITNLMSLIRILEKRDVLRPDSLDPFNYLAEQLQRKDIIRFINNPDDERPVLVQPLTSNIGHYNENGSTTTSRVLPQIDPDPERRVYDLICADIGKKWKDFARALKIPEGFIDELEDKHRHRIPEMTREVIVYHRQSCDPRYWRVELCQGLIKARRSDLSLSVEKVFAMHGLS
ncbi:hypothetical protein NQ315_005593 [Exocentrus adspersus]|uniref:Death domain-containing protein n=1 Tax=Exocentrus adspersus TaxID=1586481 RepID=A0AAV8VTH4_9CUCU|nr:hypothetical protein NQ315_005593 [Exocentrus adspersus]